MPIELKMPALSPTMEEGTVAKWLVKEGDPVKSGDILAEIETDKATMEYEAVDEGRIAKILVSEGSDAVKVGTVIAIIAQEGEDLATATSAGAPAPPSRPAGATGGSAPAKREAPAAAPSAPPPPAAAAASGPQRDPGERIKASPLARRLAEQRGIDLAKLEGSGPAGRIVKTDVDGAGQAAPTPAPAAPPASRPAPAAAPAPPRPAPPPPARAQAPAYPVPEIPHTVARLSSMRKVIARRLTESKQNVPHIYLTVDIRLDALLKLRGELNLSLESRGVKLSVNDLLIKALALSLIEVPECNVQFTGSDLITFQRADISVAVSIPGGLITPIVASADSRSVSAIASEMKDLAARARDGKLKPEEYQGGTASLSNMGMYGIRQFEAVINPPQAMIMAIGAGEKRPWVIDDSLQIATVMSATGSFDHRAIDGADGARLMQAFKRLVEAPLGMLA